MENFKQLSREGREELKELAISLLEDNIECYGHALHHHAYNEDYFIIGRYEAEQWLSKHFGIFPAIEVIKQYEQDHFGEVTTDLSEAENVCNMLVYIIGEEILGESKTLQDKWNNALDADDCTEIISELKGV